MVFIHAPVGKNHNVGALSVNLIHLYKQPLHGPRKLGGFIVSGRNHCHLKAFLLHIFDFQQIGVCENRVIDFQYLTVFRYLLQQISVLAYIHGGTGDNFLTDSVNRRIGDLCKKLFKVIEQRPVLLRKHSQRGIHTHGSNALCPV